MNKEVERVQQTPPVADVPSLRVRDRLANARNSLSTSADVFLRTTATLGVLTVGAALMAKRNDNSSNTTNVVSLFGRRKGDEVLADIADDYNARRMEEGESTGNDRNWKRGNDLAARMPKDDPPAGS